MLERALPVVVSVAAVGCATLVDGPTQSIRIASRSSSGAVLDDSDCSLSNDQGSTTVRSGGEARVRRSSKDLEIVCRRRGEPDAVARLVSRTQLATFVGNAALTGGVGGIVDVYTGNNFRYPSRVELVHGETLVFDRRDEQDGQATPPRPPDPGARRSP